MYMCNKYLLSLAETAVARGQNMNRNLLQQVTSKGVNAEIPANYALGWRHSKMVRPFSTKTSVHAKYHGRGYALTPK